MLIRYLKTSHTFFRQGLLLMVHILLVINSLNAQNLVIPPFKQVQERTPEYPLKTQRMIYGEQDLDRARQNILKYPEARKVQEEIIKGAAYWLDWTDSDLRDLLADARVPRAFDLNPKGSPVHGDAVFKKGGTYPWIIDPRHPFQVKSPIDGQIFPTNDYAAYYKSGFKDKKNWDKEYTDDGWGWVAPDGERYWFVAYANHWVWKSHIEPGLVNLSRAYMLTGDKRYAHKAAVMLHRMAEVYPSMDHANQSRYGLISKSEGRTYDGKIVNLIWETSMIQNAAEAYDEIWETIDGDTGLQEFYRKSGQGIRSFIEANLLEDALDGYLQQKIRGNYGMHQSALLYILLARQNMDTEKYLHMIIDEPGATRLHTGIRYALYNMIFRDGIPLESPGYNMITVDRLATLGKLLQKGGTNLFEEPRMKMLFDGPLNMVATGLYTPDIGDTGTVLGQVTGVAANDYQIAYDSYKDPRYLTWLASINKTGPQTFSTFESLFSNALPETKALPAGRAVAPQATRLLAGYGLGIMNDRLDTNALSFNYGYKGTHYHWDFLNFELFANGQKMMPDLGYPDAMNEYVKEVYAWSTNTVSHNTVVVDAQRQDRNLPGILHDFASGQFARSMDASAPAYAQTSLYRRNLIQIDADDKQSYVVDFFRVNGGKQHDYVLHGPPGTVTWPEGKWSEQLPGTLAGPNVEHGQLYDDAKLGVPGYAGGFGKYRGSGFQYLFHVQKFETGKTVLEYQHVRNEKAKLKIHLLPFSPQEVFMADAYDKPRAKTHVLKYLVARRAAINGEPLKSTFVSVLETYGSKAYIQSARLVALDAGRGTAVEVKRVGGVDVVMSDTANSVKKILQYGIETDANSAVITFNSKGEPVRVFFSNGTYLRCKGKNSKAGKTEGIVRSVDSRKQLVQVQFSGNGPLSQQNISGTVAHFSNAYRTTAHPLAEITGTGHLLTIKTTDDLLTGKIRLKAVSESGAVTDTDMPFAPLYAGATILNGDFQPAAVLVEAKKGTLKMAGKPTVKLSPGDDIWISDIGIGDKVILKANFTWTKP